MWSLKRSVASCSTTSGAPETNERKLGDGVELLSCGSDSRVRGSTTNEPRKRSKMYEKEVATSVIYQPVVT